MLGKTYSAIIVISVVFAIYNGNVGALGAACVDGAISAVRFMLELGAITAFWCGVMAVFESIGLLKAFSKLIYPLTQRIFPDAAKRGAALEEISMNIGANFLGLGNAATPMGIRAMEKMHENNVDNDDMVMLTVLNTASVQFIPTTLLSLRMMSGSQNPHEVIVPIWICSCITVTFAIAVTKASAFVRRKGMKWKE